jgi:DASS family divalent anion:Na+ symporter
MDFKLIPAAVAVLIGMVIWFAISVPEGVTPQAWHLLALFVAIIGRTMTIGALTGVTSA